jgi:hypothetical protein
MEQALETLLARLEQKSAQIKRLEDAREEVASEYCAPQKYSEYDYENYDKGHKADFEDDDEAEWAQRMHVASLFKQDEENQKSKQKSKQSKQKRVNVNDTVNLQKKQGATPSTHQTRLRRLSGGPGAETRSSPPARHRRSRRQGAGIANFFPC